MVACVFASSPSPARVLAVNVALPVDRPAVRSAEWTAINKQPVLGDVTVRSVGLSGDEVGDKRFHGGPDKAVYAYAREDLDLWSERLGTHLRSGSMFGENLTTTGIDVNQAIVGERWRVGTALLEVRTVRIPCTVFQNWLNLSGHHASGWLRRFTAEARPGPYLGVVEEGVLATGDEIVVESRPLHGVTVSMLFQALTTNRALLPELLKVDTLPPDIRAKAERYAAREGLIAPALAR